ncbi:hypothetical protein AHF37_08797 [Paragonimus kellicotti]|nr:hypothetical protein AHF37_08797 [Paragonimus kellicotti]
MFCKTKSGCPPKGLVALEPCLSSKGVKMPMFLSQPSFIGADPQISGAFDGLPTPDLEKHVTTVHIEPTTGFLLEAFKRVQFNVYMNSTTKNFKDMKGPFYFPIGWLEETAIADKKSLDEIYNRILLPRKRMPIILSVVSAIATMIAVTIILSLAICVRSRTRSRRSKRNATVTPAIPTTTSISSKDEVDAKAAPTSAVSHWSTGPVVEADPLLTSRTKTHDLETFVA